MNFLSPEETQLTEQFLREGYIIAPAEDKEALQYLHDIIQPREGLLVENLNIHRLKVIEALNNSDRSRLAYFCLAQNLLFTLIGNELAMQKKFNLSIQLPHDASSLLQVHADSWAGDSPYQLVLWTSFCDCTRTKSMYILPPREPFSVEGSSEDVYQRIKDRVKFLDVKYGEIVVFNPTLPHGNRVNEEEGTRWTINCRFKNLWSPYAGKGLGTDFEPITLRAASRIGMAYEHPKR